MGRFNFSDLPSRSSNLGTVTPLPVEAEPREMPRGQMIALLRIRGGGPDSLFAKVLAYLEAVGSDEPSGADYTALREARYIHFNGQARLDVLMPPGLSAAERIAREVARRCGIHHVTYRFKTPRNNSGSFAWCSCGHWRQTVSRKQGDEDRLVHLAGHHLEQVAKGTFKPPRPIEEFLNEVMPLRLPLEMRR